MERLLKPGSFVVVNAYKHNGQIYRIWNNVMVLEHTEDHLVLVNQNVLITNLKNKETTRLVKQPALWQFIKGQWSNIICRKKNNNFIYYANIASPYYINKDNVINYIDYDLDLTVNSNGKYKMLDLNEFKSNFLKYGYSKKIIENIWDEITVLEEEVLKKQNFFKYSNIKKYWDMYEKIKHKFN